MHKSEMHFCLTSQELYYFPFQIILGFYINLHLHKPRGGRAGAMRAYEAQRHTYFPHCR